MKEKKRKFRLRLVKNGEVTHRVKPSVIQLREIPVDVEDLEFQLLTVALNRPGFSGGSVI
jgi:hypothetical protein